MINPPISELTKNSDINRYALVVATAKCARIITDEYVAERESPDRIDIKEEKRPEEEEKEEKAVKLAILGLHSGEFKIIEPDGREILLSDVPEADRIVRDEEHDIGEADL